LAPDLLLKNKYIEYTSSHKYGDLNFSNWFRNASESFTACLCVCGMFTCRTKRIGVSSRTLVINLATKKIEDRQDKFSNAIVYGCYLANGHGLSRIILFRVTGTADDSKGSTRAQRLGIPPSYTYQEIIHKNAQISFYILQLTPEKPHLSHTSG
jgi:hypothetical protein